MRTRGDLTLNAQLEGSKMNNGAFNGGDASMTGVSLLAAYKLTPEWEAHIRGDYLDNGKNGGGGAAIVFGTPCPDDGTGTATLAAICGDYCSGFGPGCELQRGLRNLGAWQYQQRHQTYRTHPWVELSIQRKRLAQV